MDSTSSQERDITNNPDNQKSPHTQETQLGALAKPNRKTHSLTADFEYFIRLRETFTHSRAVSSFL
jgi:hypothetical protein